MPAIRMRKEKKRIMTNDLRGTTIVAVRKGGKVAIAGDGQVTQGQSSILKGNARKVRRIYNDKIVIGFAGSTNSPLIYLSISSGFGDRFHLLM